MSGARSLLALGECMVEFAPADKGKFQRGFAGDTFNTAWYARRLLPDEWTVAYGTCVGTDAVSDEMVAFMEREGIDVSTIRRLPNRTVGLYTISLRDGERSFSYWRAQSAARTLADDAGWLESILAERDFVHVSGITLAILPPQRRCELCSALVVARARGTQVSLDTNIRPRLWESVEATRDGLQMGACAASIVLPSFDEESQLFGDGSPDDTIARYREAGARLVAVKEGAGPVTVWSSDAGTKIYRPPAVPEVVDTTAAGDSFAAALLTGLATGQTLDDSVCGAMRLAARVVQVRGALAADIFETEVRI